MQKKYGFYIALLVIYVLFLCKDSFFINTNYQEDIHRFVCEVNEKNYKEEYESLSALHKMEPLETKMVYARLSNRNMYEFFDTLTIDKGKLEGIKKGSLVISDQGVIGVIDQVNHHSSKVLLLTNAKINLSVKIGESYGILTSKDHQVIVKNMKINDSIKEKDLVKTSGLTNIPANFLIGTVAHVNKDSLELEYILDINLASDIKNIRYVGVLVS